jgi:DNA-binding response OmpR family regulator
MNNRVLIVDDEVMTTNLIEASLARKGYETKSVFDGEGALRAFSEWKPDLILLDIMMPDMDGLEVCRKIRELEEPHQHTPILLQTALTQLQDKEKGFLAGADDYLTKPYHPTELALRVGAHINRQRKLSVAERMVFPPFSVDDPTDVRRAMRMFDRFTITILIPVLNEEGSIPQVLAQIPKWVDEVLLVDGHSTDKTVEVATKAYPHIIVITQPGKGKGDALRCGLEAAKSDIIVTMDGDGSMDPTEIPFFVGALLSGADYVKGSRFLQGAGTVDMPWIRILGNGLLVQLANFLFGVRYSDITYGFNAIWRKNISCTALEIDGWPNEIISNIRVVKHKLRVVEVACFEQGRIAGEAKLEAFQAGWKILLAMITEWLNWKRNGVARYRPPRYTPKSTT